MGALASYVYSILSEDYFKNHHERKSDIVHNSFIWVNNITNEPCNEHNGLCDTCKEFVHTGYPLPTGGVL